MLDMSVKYILSNLFRITYALTAAQELCNL